MVKWFKKKEIEEPDIKSEKINKKKIDYTKYKIKMNMKSLCYYEQLTQSSAFNISSFEGIIALMYSTLVVNNPNLVLTFKGFQIMIKENESFVKWLLKEYQNYSKMSEQIKDVEGAIKDGNDEDEPSDVMLRDIVAQLIVTYGIDPRYVMEDMNMWELKHFVKAYNENKKNQLTEQRLFTYLTMAPHMDSKKIKGPEDILPFSWEKDDKDKALEDLNKKTEMIKGVFDYFKQLKEQKTEEDNG